MSYALQVITLNFGIYDINLIVPDALLCLEILSSNQLCDKSNSVNLNSSRCMAIKYKYNQIVFTNSRSRNAYTVSLNKIPLNDVFLVSNEDKSWLWNRRISHIHMDHLNKLVNKDLVITLPNMRFGKSQLCDVC